MTEKGLKILGAMQKGIHDSSLGRGVRRTAEFIEGKMDREDMSKALKAQRKSATKQRKRTAELRKADRAAGEKRRKGMSGLRGGGKVEMGYKKGGSVKSKSIDGIAQHGKTRGTMR